RAPARRDVRRRRVRRCVCRRRARARGGAASLRAVHRQGPALATGAVTARAFTTTFGESIPVVPGYRAAHLAVRPSAVFSDGARRPPLGIDGFIKDVYQYALMLDFLRNVHVDCRWRAALDVGGAEGTVSRLLRGQGLAAHVTTVEIED